MYKVRNSQVGAQMGQQVGKNELPLNCCVIRYKLGKGLIFPFAFKTSGFLSQINRPEAQEVEC